MDRPIIFSGPMVRALLAGRKTQTRRLINPQPELFPIDAAGTACTVSAMQVDGDAHHRVALGSEKAGVLTTQVIRYGIGDRLYVREAHYLTDDGDYERAVYAEDGESVGQHFAALDLLPSGFPADVIARHRRLRPSIHMPRWASRLTLIVEAVKVERLQDISEDDAHAEGVDADFWDMAPVARDYGHDDAWFVGWSIGVNPPSTSVDAERVCRESFRSLWELLHGEGSWDANPFVVALTFSVVPGNIDRLSL